MSSTFSPLDRFELMADGEDNTTWGDKTNVTWALVEQLHDGTASIVVSAGGSFTASTANGATDQARMGTIILTGSPVSSTTLIMPAHTWFRCIINNSSQAVSVVTTAGGSTGPNIAAGAPCLCYSDGTNVYEAQGQISNFISSNVTISGGTINGITLDGGTY